jgi:hypothetical protein
MNGPRGDIVILWIEHVIRIENLEIKQAYTFATKGTVTQRGNGEINIFLRSIILSCRGPRQKQAIRTGLAKDMRTRSTTKDKRRFFTIETVRCQTNWANIVVFSLIVVIHDVVGPQLLGCVRISLLIAKVMTRRTSEQDR